jgi:hypothetical protein
MTVQLPGRRGSMHRPSDVLLCILVLLLADADDSLPPSGSTDEGIAQLADHIDDVRKTRLAYERVLDARRDASRSTKSLIQ